MYGTYQSHSARPTATDIWPTALTPMNGPSIQMSHLTSNIVTASVTRARSPRLSATSHPMNSSRHLSAAGSERAQIHQPVNTTLRSEAVVHASSTRLSRSPTVTLSDATTSR